MRSLKEMEFLLNSQNPIGALFLQTICKFGKFPSARALRVKDN